jgi:dihydropteroate synthase
MAKPPRFLYLPDGVELRRELRSFGVDTLAARRLAADNVHRCIRFFDLPRHLAASLLQQMRSLGGEGVIPGGDAERIDLFAVLPAATVHLLLPRLANSTPELLAQGEELANLVRRMEHPLRYLRGKDCRLDLSRPRIMGVLNITPDSFSDGGQFISLDQALRRAAQMVAEGADLIDVGGESTRPGAATVSAQEEMDRVVPVIEALRREFTLPLSIDTSKSAVARAAMAAGASFINDISGLSFDARMAEVAADCGAGLFLMHTRGLPQHMQNDTAYEDLLGDIFHFLHGAIRKATAAGIAERYLAVDPGIGFGKSAEGNLQILKRLSELRGLGRPILLGTSRKSFLGRIIAQPQPQQRLYGSLATVALGVAQGAAIFRVHDVRASREAALTAWAVRRGRLPQGDL